MNTTQIAAKLKSISLMKLEKSCVHSFLLEKLSRNKLAVLIIAFAKFSKPTQYDPNRARDVRIVVINITEKINAIQGIYCLARKTLNANNKFLFPKKIDNLKMFIMSIKWTIQTIDKMALSQVRSWEMDMNVLPLLF